MIFVRTFKGYEDKTADLDKVVNDWVAANASAMEVVDVKTQLSHEDESRARSGDLIYTVVYKADSPLD